MLILEENTLLLQNVGNRLASEAASYPDRCWIVRHFILSDGTYIELSSYKYFYCSYTWAARLIIGVFFWISPSSAGSRFSGSLFNGVFRLEADVAGDAPVVDVQTLREAFLKHHQGMLVSLMQLFFLIKSKTSGLGITLKCQIIGISRLAGDGLKELLL